MGRYNAIDSNGTYAAIIGNGTSNNDRSNALTVDWSGNVGIAGDVQDLSGNQLYADATHTHSTSDVTGLGTRLTDDQSANVSVANTTWTKIASVTLAAGTWMVFGYCSFASNATGFRAVCISSNSTEPTDAEKRQRAANCNAINGGMTRLHTSASLIPNASTEYSVWAYHNRGSALNVTGFISAVRIA